MKFLMANLYLLLLGVLLLLDGTVGQTFFKKYKAAIENYIMTGEEEGNSQHCDILSAGTHSHVGIAQITMALDKINMLNFKNSSSKCLLVNYDVTRKADLSALLEFGWAAFYHIRLALVVKLHSGLTLGMARNTSKLPYLVAAESSEGKEQFLCPVVGELEPRLQKHLCEPSYVSYKNKILRIGIMGIPPAVFMTEKGPFAGMNLRLLKMLEQRLDFGTAIIVPNSFLDAGNKVWLN